MTLDIKSLDVDAALGVLFDPQTDVLEFCSVNGFHLHRIVNGDQVGGWHGDSDLETLRIEVENLNRAFGAGAAMLETREPEGI